MTGQQGNFHILVPQRERAAGDSGASFEEPPCPPLGLLVMPPDGLDPTLQALTPPPTPIPPTRQGAEAGGMMREGAADFRRCACMLVSGKAEHI